MSEVHGGDLHDRFEVLDLSLYPAFSELDNDLDRVLWVMLVAHREFHMQFITPHQVAMVLRDVMRYHLTRQRVDAILSESKGLAILQRRGSLRHFQIMQTGLDRVEAARRGVVFIEPDQGLTRTREVQDLLSGVAGRVMICDPYWAPRSLDFLTGMKKASEVRILTDKIDKPETVKRDLKPLRNELGVAIDVRSAPPRVLHDRYVIDDTSMLILGTSLNGIGLKQSIVVSVGPDLRAAAAAAFERLWAAGVPL